MKKILILISILIFFLSCKENRIRYLEVERKQFLRNGEWVGEKDSTSGVSSRKNNIGFFKNWKLAGDDVYKYIIIDSIKLVDNKIDTLKTFLKWSQIHKNTLYFELIKYDSIELIMRDNENNISKYSYKKL